MAKNQSFRHSPLPPASTIVQAAHITIGSILSTTHHHFIFYPFFIKSKEAGEA